MSAESVTSSNHRIFYPGPDIVVTDVSIETPSARYPVRRLTILDPQQIYAYPGLIVALYCGAMELLLAITIAALYGSAEALLCTAGVVAGSGMAGAILVDNRRNPRWMELTALYEGRLVVLFSTDNHRVFGQVHRAVVRALEANRPPRP
ncbi:DUF6232 family protein [Couchioplanes caeruleus]|uniref:DUF6232 family protein n=1 Tax=Couchioplanes caeruleus TaxID=56438 RepID=UPI0020C1667D|nr:DUF6232 family protein [Couchioplanes caeruleus]UQU65720.1 DUF6232 family protein [Couchioplanes caeruleus]